VNPTNAASVLRLTILSNTPMGGTNSMGIFFWLTNGPDPQRTLVPSGPYVTLTWPTNHRAFSYTGYTLQSTTNPSSPAVWATNSPAPVVG